MELELDELHFLIKKLRKHISHEVAGSLDYKLTHKILIKSDIDFKIIYKGAPSLLQLLEWKNKALTDALQYLVDTKHRKDTIGKDSIYLKRKQLGWMKAKSLLKD